MGSLVRVQLSPPLASPCRSRACFFFLCQGVRLLGSFFFGLNKMLHQLSRVTVAWLRWWSRMALLPESRRAQLLEIRAEDATACKLLFLIKLNNYCWCRAYWFSRFSVHKHKIELNFFNFFKGCNFSILHLDVYISLLFFPWTSCP